MKFKHGMSKTPIHNLWWAMMQRCYDKNSHAYADYGGRGLEVCVRWQTFTNFFEDMGHRPPGKYLERKDNDGPYCPENCQWATPKQQGRNKRNNVLVERDGAVKPLSQWCEELGLKYTTGYMRLKRGNPLV